MLLFSQSSYVTVKLQAFILVQKEHVILFVTLLSYHRPEVLISVAAAHRSALFYQNHAAAFPLEEWLLQNFC